MRTKSEFDFPKWRESRRAEVEARLAGLFLKMLPAPLPETGRLVEAMRYSALSGGKRLRPLLALAGAEAVGGPAAAAWPAALALELIHTYSLIHDDLPALDDDDLRRGRPTCHKVFGEALAILAGDALLTLAFEVLSGSGREPARTCLAIRIVSRAAGPFGMVGGQVLDLAFEKMKPSAVMVREMERQKTGELIAAALTAGAALAGAGPARLTRLREIGHTIGLAFQIKDDLLNLTGDSALLGKAVGSDAEKGKATLPALLGPRAAGKEMEKLKAEALERTGHFGLRGRPLGALLSSLINRDF